MLCKRMLVGKLLFIMKHEIHLNEEFIKGFIEGLIFEYEDGLGPFLSWIHNYEIIVDKPEDLITRIRIPYDIISDNRANLFVQIEISSRTSLEAFRLKIKFAIEEIIQRVRSFEKDQDGK